MCPILTAQHVRERVVRKKATVVTNKKKEPHIVFKSFNFFDSVVTKIKLLEVDQGGKARHDGDTVALQEGKTKVEKGMGGKPRA